MIVLAPKLKQKQYFQATRDFFEEAFIAWVPVKASYYCSLTILLLT
jgi:hypothetical protein